MLDPHYLSTYRNENQKRLPQDSISPCYDNRLQALLGVIDYLNRKGWTASNLNQQISKWSNMDAEGRYKEYNSIVVWYLKKKQRQCDL